MQVRSGSKSLSVSLQRIEVSRCAPYNGIPTVSYKKQLMESNPYEPSDATDTPTTSIASIPRSALVSFYSGCASMALSILSLVLLSFLLEGGNKLRFLEKLDTDLFWNINIFLLFGLCFASWFAAFVWLGQKNKDINIKGTWQCVSGCLAAGFAVLPWLLLLFG